jgi:ribose/xylose/arabinose/galactoside ABC-type transport system permease subunit
MEESLSSPDRTVKWIRWTVQILSLLFVAFYLYIFIGEALEGRSRPNNPPMATRAVVELTIVGVSLLGLLLAWKWELAGGTVALAAFVLACLINHRLLVFYPVAIAAILFLACGWFSRPHRPSV